MLQPNKLLNKNNTAKGSYERIDITMAKLNRICTICHKKYSYCPTCASDLNRPTWLAVFCCDNCKDLYNVINDYRYKSLTKEQAFCKLNTLDLSCVNELPDNFKQILNEILNKGCDTTDEVIVEPVVDEPIVEVVEVESVEQEIQTIKDEIIEDEVVENEITEERKYKKAKKRNYNRKDIVDDINSNE